LSLEQWEAYYRNGAIATCPTAADGGYDLEVRQAWVEFFATLPSHASILDVGTGNGVVAQIAAETAATSGRVWDIHATDLAEIDPLRYVTDGARRLAGITFHPRVATEQLPFSEHRFDAVSGHYALEYTDTGRALAEIHRVLKPNSEAQFIIHSDASLLVGNAAQSLRETDLVLSETQLYRRVHQLVTMHEVTAGATEQAVSDLRAAIQAVKRALAEAQKVGAGHVLSVALNATQQLLAARNSMQPQPLGLEVDRAERELQASARRLLDLVEHAQDAQGMDRIQQQAAAAGFGLIERLPQYHGGRNLVGWQLLLRRN